MQRIALSIFGIGFVSLAALGEERPTPPKLQSFPLNAVTISDPALLAARQKNREYLLSLDADRLLHVFRVNAGLPSTAQPLGGWEAPGCEVRGHFVGHYLSACAILYEATKDEEIRARGETIVTELGKCQKALGGEYLSAYPESFLDRLEAGQAVWAPYYVIHKILAGLYDMHIHAGSKQALEIAERMAGYIQKRSAKFTPEQLRAKLDKNEEGGLCELLWNLYAITQDPKARDAADRLERRTFLDPLARGEDNLAARHGNTHIPLAVGAVRRYELTGQERYRYAAEYFWNRVVFTRSYATGGSTDAEFWGEPFKLARALSVTNHETCKTYNMLRLTQQCFCHTLDPQYADFYERAFLNGILGTQEPASGMLEYYVPMAPGHKRVYGTPTGSFWCCTGTGVETWSKLGDSISFHDADNLYVNLYIASKTEWAEKDATIEQITRYPDEETVTLTVQAKKPVKFTLHLRIPGWLRRDAVVELDGRKVEAEAVPGRFLAIQREWRGGEKIQLTLPMDLYTSPMPDDPNLVAIMHGPLVLAGLIDENEPNAPIIADPPVVPQPQAEMSPRLYFTASSPSDLSWLKPVADQSHTFRASGQPFATKFVPFNRIIGQRYAIYFPVVPAGSDRVRQMKLINQAIALLPRAAGCADAAAFDAIQKEFETILADPVMTGERDRLLGNLSQHNPIFRLDGAEVVDRVRPGDGPSESEHNLQHKGSESGPYQNRNWRHARSGAWWSWDLKVPKDASAAVRCIYLGDDIGRVFDVLVDDRKIATQKLERNLPGRFFFVDHPIPADVMQGKDKITIRFQPHEGSMAGGVFGCATVRLK